MENVLLIEVDSRESQDLPPFGRAIDYMTFGGLYREVYLDIREKYCITDVFARTEKIMEEKPVLSSEITLDTGEEIRRLSLAGKAADRRTYDQTEPYFYRADRGRTDIRYLPAYEK